MEELTPPETLADAYSIIETATVLGMELPAPLGTVAYVALVGRENYGAFQTREEAEAEAAAVILMRWDMFGHLDVPWVQDQETPLISPEIKDAHAEEDAMESLRRSYRQIGELREAWLTSHTYAEILACWSKDAEPDDNYHQVEILEVYVLGAGRYAENG